MCNRTKADLIFPSTDQAKSFTKSVGIVYTSLAEAGSVTGVKMLFKRKMFRRIVAFVVDAEAASADNQRNYEICADLTFMASCNWKFPVI